MLQLAGLVMLTLTLLASEIVMHGGNVAAVPATEVAFKTFLQ
jgi:hypothetical protein